MITAKFKDQYEQLWKDLVPKSGESTVLAGELIRAVGRLNYDFHNNGMGNNTSGAINFLNHHSAISSADFGNIYYWTRGRVYNGSYDGDSLTKAMNSIVDSTVQMIINNPQLMSIENTKSMFDFEDEDLMFCEVCGDAFDDFGSLCEICEEAEQEEFV